MKSAGSSTYRVRQAVLLVSLMLALITVIILASDQQDCSTANLKFAMFLMFTVYAAVFVLMLLQFVGMVGCLKKIPTFLMTFYFMVVFVMFFVQMILFQGNNCY